MLRSNEDRSITKARQEIYDALRFLNPSVAEEILKDLHQDMKNLADKYDRMLSDICN